MRALGQSYKDAEASMGGRKKLPAGGYIAEIKAVEDKADKEYLSIVYDVAEGEFKAFYADDWGKEHPYAHRFFRSYKEKAHGMFKGFLTAIDQSNGTNLADEAGDGLQEQKLVGKKVGLIIGYEEYENERGDVRQRPTVTEVRTVDTIRSGDFEVPALKKLAPRSESPVEGFEQVNDADLPF